MKKILSMLLTFTLIISLAFSNPVPIKANINKREIKKYTTKYVVNNDNLILTIGN